MYIHRSGIPEAKKRHTTYGMYYYIGRRRTLGTGSAGIFLLIPLLSFYRRVSFSLPFHNAYRFTCALHVISSCCVLGFHTEIEPRSPELPELADIGMEAGRHGGSVKLD